METGKPMAGICRGGQFLNVMCGGKLWQHADNHATNGTHQISDIVNKFKFYGTSTHHQIMVPAKKSLLVGVAAESNLKERMGKGESKPFQFFCKKGVDPEIIFYEDQKAFCFQPHPEFPNHSKLKSQYFWYLQKYLNLP
jgi:carbamoylphosphate synthase small subunit